MGALVPLYEASSGSISLPASSSAAVSIAEGGAGRITFGGVASTGIPLSESGRIALAYAAQGSGLIRLSEASAGQLLRVGAASAAVKLFESASAANQGVGSGVVALGESCSGLMPVTGLAAGAIRLGESCCGLIVETTDGVWVVNLFTGGHSRYAGALDGSQPVAAFAITPVSQLGTDKTKFVGTAYVDMRTMGTVDLTTVADEFKPSGPYPLGPDNLPGIHKRRVRLAKGVRAQNWQFRLDTSSETAIKSLEVSILPSMQSKPRLR